MKTILVGILLTTICNADINVKKIKADLSKEFRSADVWASADAEQTVTMMAQPATVPKPKTTETPQLQVTALHDGKWIAFKMRWKDPEASVSERLATFSDAVALQFPVKNNEVPPPIMMGVKDDPVHLFHWRYQYQLDAENGKKTIDQIYPNMTTDMYPMEFKDKGNYKESTKEQRDSFVGGTAAGNPQSFPKFGVDEIFAEGFGSSSVSGIPKAMGKGEWKDGEWVVYLVRPLKYDEGSQIEPGKKTNVAFAVWQGGKKEIGALKSLTLMWTPVNVMEK